MLGGHKDWIPARAEPLNYTVREGSAEGLENPFVGLMEVTWRIHIDGREPYEFSERRRAPWWTKRGSRYGRRWFHLRVRASRGLLREVGVPCRVHPDKPGKIDIDWSAAYDEHQPAWEHRDHRSKAYSKRAEGPLGKVLSPVEFAGLKKLSAEEQAEVDREVEERIAREEALPSHVQAVVDENEWVAAQGVEAQRLYKVGMRRSATVTALHSPPAGSIVYTIGLDVEGLGAVEHRQALNDAWAAMLAPGAQTAVMVDPADASRMTLG